jgi:hypothetical protein
MKCLNVAELGLIAKRPLLKVVDMVSGNASLAEVSKLEPA